MMQRRVPCAGALVMCTLIVLLLAAPAAAQYGPYRSDPATGERYVVELSVGLWSPTLEAIIASESLNIPGTQIDVVADLGLVDDRFPEFRAVLRPGRKHKLRVSYVPIEYEAETVLSRNIIFNGILFPVRVPVRSNLEWKVWRVGYEWDFVYRDRGFVGLLLEAKYTQASARLSTFLASEFTRAKAPIPAIGGIARGYLFRNIAVTGEVSGFKLPGDILKGDKEQTGSYLDFDVYATLNVVNNLGVMAGYRRVDVEYRVDQDLGDLTFKGFYVQAVVRF